MKRVLISFALLFFGLFFIWFSNRPAAQKIEVPGCRQVEHPQYCVEQYRKCQNLGLDDACLAVAQLEGEIGHSVTHTTEKQMSQNNIKGDEL